MCYAMFGAKLRPGGRIVIVDARVPPTELPAAEAKIETTPQRYVLPKNLRNAVKHLSDGELSNFFFFFFFFFPASTWFSSVLLLNFIGAARRSSWISSCSQPFPPGIATWLMPNQKSAMRFGGFVRALRDLK